MMKNESASSPHDAVKKAKREMIRSAVFALAALVVIIIACIAWFTNNTKVTGTTGMISASGSTFELASVGEKGAFDNTGEPYTEGAAWELDTAQGRRTELNNVVQWRLSADSNIGNDAAKGIRPGASGQLQFYVLPKVENLKLKFQLNILPMQKTDNKIVAYTGENQSTLENLLKGHIMFSYSCKYDNDNNGSDGNAASGVESGASGWIPCDTGSFEIECHGTDPQLVTLDWEWPYQWSSIENNRQTVIKEIQNYMQYFFYSVNGGTEDEKYNAADEFIGQNVTWLMVQLTAEIS